MTADPRPTLASPDDDPYLWLEEVHGDGAVAWVDAHHAATRAEFGGAQFTRDRDAVLAILDRTDKIPFITRRGKHVFNFWQDAANPRGVWRRTTLASFRTAGPEWEVLLDLDALSKAEGEEWVWGPPATLPPAHERAILSLSRAGGDAVVLREYDLAAKAFVTDGFVLGEAKSGADWLDRDTLLLTSPIGPDMATDSGYARTVRLWRRGTGIDAAPVLFEAKRSSIYVGVSNDRTSPGRVWYIDAPGFFDTVVWIGDGTGPKRQLDLPSHVRVGTFGDWMTVQPKKPWTIGATTHSADSLLGIGLDAFLAGSRDFAVLFEPGERRVLENTVWADGRVVLSILDDLAPRFEVLTPSTDGWSRATLEGLPHIGVVGVGRLDAEDHESNGDLLAMVQDPLTPPSLLLIEPGKAPELLKRAPATFTADGLVVTRHEALSSDGERIPYVQVGPPGETGDAPVHMTGYGGFEVSVLPTYDAPIGKLWLERGGTRVVANIRGGGEFGVRWHEAGRREKKRLSHDDFAAVAADLVRRGVTRPGRIAAEGGSNGGLLIANMLTRYPERFGALLCAVPLIDMRRYNKLLAGASWVEEYGDPDKVSDWAFLQLLSAYHVAAPGQAYPPMLIATSRTDDRVHPGHARKMAAKLEALGYPVWYYEPAAGGHSYGQTNAERAAMMALGMTFLAEKIGWRVAEA